MGFAESEKSKEDKESDELETPTKMHAMFAGTSKMGMLSFSVCSVN